MQYNSGTALASIYTCIRWRVKRPGCRHDTISPSILYKINSNNTKPCLLWAGLLILKTMKQKQVKIIGLSVNQQFGILQATELKFDAENNLHIVKGEVGAGKTSLMKALQLGTQGAKTLQDAGLYGKIDTETQLLDGEIPVFVGTRSTKDGKLIHTLYTKDSAGKVVKTPVIDGQKATPSKYLELLQTELTWKMDELTSENPTVQKKILLKLYQDQLSKVGVIFNKQDPAYNDSILHKIDKAEQNRTFADAVRKQKGGIADDLKARGYDVTRPETLPERIDIDALKEKYRQLDREIAVAKTEAKNKADNAVQALKTRAKELLYKAKEYNSELEKEYEKKQTDYYQKEKERFSASDALNVLIGLGYKGKEVGEFIENMPQPEKPAEPNYIQIENDKIVGGDHPIVAEVVALRKQLKSKLAEQTEIDTSEKENQLQQIENQITQAYEINEICDAVDSFFEWQEHNDTVQKLKKEYEKLLTSVDTGVKGLTIHSIDEELFLMYNGAYDPQYFNNPKNEYRKLSSYSGTQKPVICLLIQSHLLNEKPKALRYMYIDNVPMDAKTTRLLDEMAEKLDVKIFLNITGDYKASDLSNGEILIENGEIITR